MPVTWLAVVGTISQSKYAGYHEPIKIFHRSAVVPHWIVLWWGKYTKSLWWCGASVNCTMVGKIHQIILALWCQGAAVNCTMVGKIYQITAMPLYCSATVLWCYSELYHGGKNIPNHLTATVNCTMVGKIYQYSKSLCCDGAMVP